MEKIIKKVINYTRNRERKLLDNVNYIKKIVEKTKKRINKNLQKKKYEDALLMISDCANVLYQTNLYYQDDDLENYIIEISRKLNLHDKTMKDEEKYGDCILFFDGFGFDNRGLIQIYLKALCKIKKVVYVTYEDRKNHVPSVLQILKEYNCKGRFINRKKSIIKQVFQLNEYVQEFKPNKMFFYSVPDDIIATTVMSAYDGVITRYQINLTDHAFWLGTRMIDICVEFRNYGASISNEYRKIDINKMRMIPYYPIVKENESFQGFPFEKQTGQKVIFSGGSLYKTLGGDNIYYKMVDHLLNTYPNLIFWYAGSGDDNEMNKIIKKYPQRAFLTKERSDLFQVLENCDVYLSTYPLCGGLMFQYAAMAGRVPVTLKKDKSTEGLLINQKNLNVEYFDVSSLYSEIDTLLNDEDYAKQRSVLMKKSVISPQVFEEEVKKMIEGNRSELFSITVGHIETNSIRKWYIERLTKSDINAMFVRRNTIKTSMVNYPYRTMSGMLRKLQKKCHKKIR